MCAHRNSEGGRARFSGLTSDPVTHLASPHLARIDTTTDCPCSHRYAELHLGLGYAYAQACMVTACFTNLIISQLSCHAAQQFYFYSTSPFSSYIHCFPPGIYRNCTMQFFLAIHFVASYRIVSYRIVCSRARTELAKLPRLYTPDGSAARRKHESAVTLSFARCRNGSARAFNVNRTKNRMRGERGSVAWRGVASDAGEARRQLRHVSELIEVIS